jgi:transcriptional regulator with XRE-family HTH domain
MQMTHPLKVHLRNRWPRMSQAELARRLTMSETQLSHYLAFRRTPPDGFYIAAALVLGVDAADIRPQESQAA